MANPKVEKVNISDMSRTQTYTAMPQATRPQAQQASHLLRLLGVVGTDAEMYALQTILLGGGNPAKRLLVAKLESIITALSAYCALTVTFSGANASSTYNGGTEINALAAYIALQDAGDDFNKSFAQTTVNGAAVDPGFN